MRQGQKEHIAGFEHFARAEFQSGALAQVGVLLVNILTQVAFEVAWAHFDIGVIEQQAEQLAARITGSANNGNSDTGPAGRL